MNFGYLLIFGALLVIGLAAAWGIAAIESKALEMDDVIPVLETVTRSSSDYEKARVMLAVATRWTLSISSG